MVTKSSLKNKRPESMILKLSKNALAMRPNAIRELLKVTKKPGIISLAGGYPDPVFFPTKALAESAKNCIQKNPDKSLGYGLTSGISELKLKISEFLKDDKIKSKEENILITNGSQQGIDLIMRTYFDPGDIIALSDPTYVGAIATMRAYRPKFLTIPLDNEGMDIDFLEKELKTLKIKRKKLKAVYIIPNFQNPTGVTLSMKRREKLIELAKRYDFMILEDDPYGRLRYRGKSVPTIKQISQRKGNDRTIYLTSFSKLLAPGLRIGAVVAEPEIIQRLILSKQCNDLCSSITSQYILLEYLKKNSMKKRLKSLCNSYNEKCHFMLKEMENNFPTKVKWTKPEGGFFIWVELPQGMDSMKIFDKAVKNKVVFVPGIPFFVKPKKSQLNTFRLAFSAVDKKKIKEGIKRLSKILNE